MPKDTEQTNCGQTPQLDDILDEFSTDKVVDFPGADDTVTARIGRLLRRADDFADQLFEAEETDPEAERTAQLLPGVDWERDTLPPRRRERKLHRVAPDTPPAELVARYSKGLGLLRLRAAAVFLLALVLVYLTVCVPLGLPLSAALSALRQETMIYLCAILLGGCMVLASDLIWVGISRFAHLRLECDTLVALAAFVTLADGLTMPRLGLREGGLPYCAAAAVMLALGLLGRFHQRRGMRYTARAASGRAPYSVTLDPDKWNHREAYTKWLGKRDGFGSQIQADDGAARIYHIAAPILLIACVLFALLASVNAGHPERMLWCLSANLCAAAGFSGLIIYAVPFSALALRLCKSGVALGGWDGICDAMRARSVILTDLDLFPPGTVDFNGIKVFGEFEFHDVVSVTATLIRTSGSGLDKMFHNLVRAQGVVYQPCDGVSAYEGGCEAVLGRRRVMVGTAAFMTLMDVDLPQGLSVKNAVFCAIEGELAGIFALNYGLHNTVRPALHALIQNGMSPVLATRDPSIIPAMLRQRFKLPVERMEFPEAARRRALSAPGQEHGACYAALLFREGIAPYAEAVVGGKRLVLAVWLGAATALLGAVTGLLLCFYLTYMAAFVSLSAVNLLLFLSLWLVPTILILGWVNRY